MCEYCTGKRILTSNNFCGEAKMKIWNDGMLDLYEEGDMKMKFFKKYYRPRFDVNYCPMCGKSLK